MSINYRFISSYFIFVFSFVNAQAQEIIEFPVSESIEKVDSFAMSIDLDDIVITAQYAPTDSKNAIQNIRTITRETIERQGANNLEQLLQQDLNIRISQDLVLGSSMSLLGVSGENIKIMIDGVPMVGRLSGNLDLSQINLNNIERVEIVEGPMAVNYGTDALGGVINLITKKSQRYPYELTLTQQLETRAENSTAVDAGIRFGDDLLVRFNGGRDWFDGFSEDSTRSVLWNPKEQWYADASLRYDFGEDQKVIYQVSYFDEEVQNLGNVRRPQFKPYSFDDFFLTKRLNYALSHEGSVFKNFYWQSTLGYNQFNREVNTYRLDFQWEDFEEAQNVIDGDTTTFDTYMLRSVLASNFRDQKLNFQLGVDLRQEDGSGARIVEEEGSTEPITIGDYAVFGSLRYRPIDDLTMETGLRAMRNTRYTAPLIPSFHLKYQLLDALSFRASYGKGFRSPSLKELFLSFIDINHFIIGNPDLQAETSNNFQANLNFDKKWSQHQLKARLHSFYNQIDNQIQLFPFLEENGLIIPTTPDQSTQYAYFNLENSRTKGLNLRLNYQFQALELEAGISKIGFFNPLSEELETVEDFTYTTELNGRIGYELPFSQTKVNLFARYNDQFISYYPETEEEKTVARQRIQDGFTMMDASLAQPLFNNRISLTFGVRNLLNITQVNVQGGQVGAHSSGSGLPIGAGRSFFVRASVRLFDNQAAKFKNAPFEQQQKSAFRLYENGGNIHASWIENRNDGEQVFQYAERKNKNWTKPKTIQIGDQAWLVNEVDAPQLVQFPDDKKTLLASWLESNNTRNIYDHHLLLSHSKNGGKQWKKAFMPYDYEVPSFYGLAKFVPLENGRLLAVWMDGRDTKKEIEDTGRYFPKMDGKMGIYAREIDEKGKKYEEQLLTTEMMPLCPFDVATSSNSTILAYRNTQNDLTIQRYETGAWTTPKTIKKDNWSTRATIEAPTIAALDDQVALAWLTKSNGQSIFQLAHSENEGQQFKMVLSQHKTELVGGIDLVWINAEQLGIIWLEKRESQIALMLTHLDLSGNILEQEELISLPMSTTQSQPILVKNKEELLITWKPTAQTQTLI
ncbi:MAG: TonB-dependent receptor, partial [Bacteroidota bacterium]